MKKKGVTRAQIKFHCPIWAICPPYMPQCAEIARSFCPVQAFRIVFLFFQTSWDDTLDSPHRANPSASCPPPQVFLAAA